MAYVSMYEEDGDESEKILATISIMTGADVDEIRTWKVSSFDQVWNTLAFLQTDIVGEKQSVIKLSDGKRYKVVSNPRNMNFGAFIDLMHFVKTADMAKKNLHNAFASCLIEQSLLPWVKDEYDGKSHAKRAEMILDLPVTVVKPHTDFFLHNYLRYSKSILVFSALLMKATKWRAKVKARFSNNTDGLTL